MTPTQVAQQRYSALGAAWLNEFHVVLGQATSGLHGRAWVTDRMLHAPWPATTRKRLYILAHEIGHVALDHRKQRPVYVQEFEAEQFAHALMRRDGIAVPRAMTERAKRYVRSKINRAFVRGGQWFDPDIAAWAGSSVVGVNWCVPPEKQRHYYATSMRRVDRFMAGERRDVCERQP
jgi:hypothetical protein